MPTSAVAQKVIAHYSNFWSMILGCWGGVGWGQWLVCSGVSYGVSQNVLLGFPETPS